MGKFACVFRSLRLSSGLTQEQLSEKIHINRSRIGMYETGRREPDFATLGLIADYFAVDMNYLLGYTTKGKEMSKLSKGIDSMGAPGGNQEEKQRAIFSKNLGRILSKCGKKQKEVADAIGESQQAMNAWVRGKSIPRMSKVQKLADYFGVQKSVFFTENSETAHSNTSTTTPANSKFVRDIPGIRKYQRIVEISSNVDADYCLRVRGDGMTGARILDGDIVFVKSDFKFESGEIYVVEIDGDTTLRRIYCDDTTHAMQMLSDNSRCAPILVMKEAINRVRIFGKVVAFQSKVL